MQEKAAQEKQRNKSNMRSNTRGIVWEEQCEIKTRFKKLGSSKDNTKQKQQPNKYEMRNEHNKSTRRQKKFIVTKNEGWASFLYTFFILNPKQHLRFPRRWQLLRNPKS
jgi:hypothetical protein